MGTIARTFLESGTCANSQQEIPNPPNMITNSVTSSPTKQFNGFILFNSIGFSFSLFKSINNTRFSC